MDDIGVCMSGSILLSKSLNSTGGLAGLLSNAMR